jgi:hypothetical protein
MRAQKGPTYAKASISRGRGGFHPSLLSGDLLVLLTPECFLNAFAILSRAPPARLISVAGTMGVILAGFGHFSKMGRPIGYWCHFADNAQPVTQLTRKPYQIY